MSVTHSFDSPYYHIDYKGFLFHVDSNKGISFLTEVHITLININFLLCGFSDEYPPQLEKTHVVPPSSQDEALCRYSVSGEVPR